MHFTFHRVKQFFFFVMPQFGFVYLCFAPSVPGSGELIYFAPYVIMASTCFRLRRLSMIIGL